MAEVGGAAGLSLGEGRRGCDGEERRPLHVTGRVRARTGQTCVVALDPIESDIDEEST